MILHYRNRAVKQIGLGILLIALLVVLVLLRHHGVPDGVIAIGALVLGIFGSLFYIQGCIALAEAKGHTGASVAAMIIVCYFCFFPLLPFIPLILLFGMNDRTQTQMSSNRPRSDRRKNSDTPKTIQVKRWRWWVYFILINLYVLSFGILGLFAGKASHGTSRVSPSLGLLFDCAVEMTQFGLVFGLAFFLSRVTPEELLLRWRGSIKPLWLGAAYAIGLRLTVGFLIRFMFFILMVAGIMAPYQMLDIGAAHSSGVERIVSTTALHQDTVFLWLSLTLTSFIFAAMAEELWRAAFFAGVKALWPQSFKSRLGQVGVVAFAAIIFGFGHTLQGSLAVLHAGLMGFGFGLIMIFHRSIWPAVIAHGLFDATSMAMMAYKQSQ